MFPSKHIAVAAFLLGTALTRAPMAARATGSVIEVTKECLEALNLARNGKLDKSVPVLKFQKDLETSAVAAVKKTDFLATEAECKLADAPPTPTKAKGLLVTELVTEATKEKDYITGTACAKIISGVVTKGLTAIGDKADVKPTEKPYADSDDAINIAYLMFADFTSVGCAATKQCPANGHNVLFCNFGKAIDDGKAPISAELFNALKAREAANVHVTNMTSADLGKKLKSGVNMVIPSAIVLAFASMVGFAAV